MFVQLSGSLVIKLQFPLESRVSRRCEIPWTLEVERNAQGEAVTHLQKKNKNNLMSENHNIQFYFSTLTPGRLQ